MQHYYNLTQISSSTINSSIFTLNINHSMLYHQIPSITYLNCYMSKHKKVHLQKLQETEQVASEQEDNEEDEETSCCDEFLDKATDKFQAFKDNTCGCILIIILLISLTALLLYTAANSQLGRPWVQTHLGINMQQVKSSVKKSLDFTNVNLQTKVQQLQQKAEQMQLTIQTLNEKLQATLANEEKLQSQLQILQEELKNPGKLYRKTLDIQNNKQLNSETPTNNNPNRPLSPREQLSQKPIPTQPIHSELDDQIEEQLKQVNQPPIQQLPSPTPEVTHDFIVQPKFWIYPQQSQNLNYLQQLMVENNKYFAKQSQYTVNVITKLNYRDLLSKQFLQRFDQLLQTLNTRLNNPTDSSNLKFHINTIEKMLTTFGVLYEQGGIITTDKFIITQNFDWIRNIKDNVYVNRGNQGAEPQVVGFYSPYYSSPLEKQNKKLYPGMEKVNKYMVVSPALEHYFIAAKKKAEFVAKLIDQMFLNLLNPTLLQQEVVTHPKEYPGLSGKDIYFEFYKLSVTKILRTKQLQLDAAHQKDEYRHFAIDYFGLFTISCYYAPYKIKIFWDNNQAVKIFQNLARYDLKQYYANVGDLRYLQFSTIPRQLNEFLTKIKEDKTGTVKGIMKGSYIQRMLFPETKEPFIYDNPQKPFVNQKAQPWIGLPKVIWVYWDKGLKNARASTQLCVQNLRRLGGQSGFIVNQINDTNLKDYLDAQILQKIQYALTNHKVITYPQTKGDFYRLAIVAKHGGIYMDSSFFALENLDWLFNIGRYPSEYIFNRYGQVPKVFMFWHPHYGSPFDWQVDQKINTKVHWHFPYENNFIAAEKQSQFVKQWLQLYLQLMQTPYNQIQYVFKTCNMHDHKWTNTDSQYLLAMDTAKCIIGRREKAISREPNSKWKGACDYYKLWSMSGYLGQQKFRSSTNYDRPGSDDHTLLYRYPQSFSEGLIGKVRHLTKLYGIPNRQLNKFITNHIDGDFSEQAHSQSVFMKFLYNKPYKLDIVDGQATIRQ